MNAQRLFISAMGAWIGLAGVEHGVGEILQGSVTPEGVMILSWPDAPFFRSLSGEPAMTVLPNMLATGILAVIVSLLFIVWALFFVERKQGGLVLMLLSVPMLMFGGGIFPPILGTLIGVAGVRLRTPRAKTPPKGLHLWLGKVWPWLFAACGMAWLALMPGVAVLDYFFGVDRAGVTLTIMAAAFGLLFLSYWGSIQRDRIQAWQGRR